MVKPDDEPQQLAPWYLRGKVIHGHGRGGTQLGFPTANIQLDEATTEQLQVYNNLVLYGWGCIEGHDTATAAAEPTAAGLGPFPFAMSVGCNPQFKDKALSAEVHFLHTFPSDFYDRVVRIVVLGSIRQQGAFSTLEKLIETIEGDVAYTKNMLATDACATYAKDRFLLPSTVLTPEESKLPYLKLTTA